MSILNRRMFAKGSEVTGQVDSASVQRIMPSPDNIRRLVEFYVADVMNATDIQERLATINKVSIPMATVEKLVIESGGSVNPSVNTNKFRLPPPPETVVTPEGGLPGIVQPAGPDLPSVDEIKIQDTSTSGQINTAVAELQEQKLIAEQELAELIENNKPKKRLGITMTMDGEPIMVNDEAIEQKRQSINQINQSIEY